MLESLAAEGVTRVLVEGGPTIAGAFLAADLVDEVVIGHGTETLGAKGRMPVGDHGLEFLATAASAGRPVDERGIGADRLTVHRRTGRFAGGANAMTTPFRYYLRVRYQECDAQHVVFNARYGDYVDLACFEFMRAALPRPTDAFDGTFEMQTVRQVIEWKAPARFDDVLEISMWASRLGTTSFTLSFEMRRAGEADVLATTETVYVHVDAQDLEEARDRARDARRAGSRRRRQDHRPRRAICVDCHPGIRASEYPGPRQACTCRNPGSRLSALTRYGRDDSCVTLAPCSPASSPISASSWTCRRALHDPLRLRGGRASPSAPRSPATAPA